MYDDFENDFPICLTEAENDIIWSKGFLYKRNYYPKNIEFKNPPDITHLHQSWWMYDDIPF